MVLHTLGRLAAVPVEERADLVPGRVLEAVRALPDPSAVGVVEVDPALSDTAASRDAYQVPAAALVNCVLVGGSRGGEERIAACLVPATTRVDVNGVVRRRLDVRKASFLARDDATGRTGMEFGGITALGLPADWPVLVDARVPDAPLVVVGSGVRRSKLLLAGAVLAALPTAEVVEHLGREAV